MVINHVEFTPRDKAEPVYNIFRELAEHCNEFKSGVKFPDLDSNDFMFDISIEGNTIRYETKWADNACDLITISDMYDLDFESSHDGDESHSIIECIEDNAWYWTVDEADVEEYYNKEHECYLYLGEAYASRYELIDLMLEQKKKEELYGKSSA